MTVEAAGFIDDIDPTQPPGTDNFSEGDDHLRNFKKSVQDSLPNISGAITATHTELNNLDGYTGNTADLNILSGAIAAGLTSAELLYVKDVTSDIQTQLGTKEPTLTTDSVSPSTHLDDAITTQGSQSIGTGATWTPSQGFYNMTVTVANTGGLVELFVSSAWRAGQGYIAGGLFCDGTNIRIRNSTGSSKSIYWQRF